MTNVEWFGMKFIRLTPFRSHDAIAEPMMATPKTKEIEFY